MHFASLLFLLLGDEELAGNEGLKGLVLDAVGGIGELGGVDGEGASKHDGLRGEDEHGALEVGNDVAGLLFNDLELLEQFVVNALLDTDLGADLVLEGSQLEGQRGETLAALGEEDSGLLDLQVVHVLELALVHSGAAL